MGFQAASWPLLDPNNAAAVINAGLIPSLYMAVRKTKWLVLVVVFGVALFLTVSKAGMIAAAIACIIIGYDAFGAYLMFPLSFIGLLFAGRFIPEITQSLNHRLEIWEVSLPLLKLFPFTGTGLGSFSFYYHQIKTPEAINVNYAHNDLLQFAVEMGLPAAFIFYLLGVAVFVKTTRDNMVSGCVLLALFIQSMLEFQFYVVSVSILSGAALAYHRLTCNSADRTMA
jgi:O-antigen ligase